jgi:hypothetical protein
LISCANTCKASHWRTSTRTLRRVRAESEARRWPEIENERAAQVPELNGLGLILLAVLLAHARINIGGVRLSTTRVPCGPSVIAFRHGQ